jgi:hypothetical protein
MKNAYEISVKRSSGKKSLEKSKHTQEDNITLEPKDIGYKDVDCILLSYL